MLTPFFEAFRITLELTGREQQFESTEENRIGDHICYYSDLSRMKADYPDWDITVPLPAIFEQLVESWKQRASA